MRKPLIYLFLAVLLAALYLLSPALWNLLLPPAALTPQQLADMKVIAHRGGASLSPENTLTAFRRGILEGADMIELDIHLSRDSQIIVCHDQTVDRTTDGRGRIRCLTLDEIRQLHVVDADGHLTDEHLPTLDEVFSLMQQVRAEGRDVRLLVEIKRTRNIYQGLEELLVQQIHDNDAASWVTVQSFNDFALERLHELDSSIRLEKLLFCKLPLLPVVVDGVHFSRFSYEKYAYVSSFNFWHRGLSRALFNELHTRGLEVKLWTLEGTDVRVLPAEGIITNRPDLWVKARPHFRTTARTTNHACTPKASGQP